VKDYYKIYDEDDYTKEIVNSIKTKDDLWKKWFDKNLPKRHKKIINIYKNVKLSGHGLELAFGLGTSTQWLIDNYPNITLDGIDFNEHLIPLIPVLKTISHRIKDFWIGDASFINKPDDHYNFVNSCSFFEHLPSEVYWEVLKECYRVLKPNGLLGVYLDTSKGKQHIRLRPAKVIRKEVESMGFNALTDYLFEKI
jgi:ubiquinone/menaquinone biosynthesis C-methylase UbiE